MSEEDIQPFTLPTGPQLPWNERTLLPHHFRTSRKPSLMPRYLCILFPMHQHACLSCSCGCCPSAIPSGSMVSNCILFESPETSGFDIARLTVNPLFSYQALQVLPGRENLSCPYRPQASHVRSQPAQRYSP